MSLSRFECPHCSAVLKSRRSVPVGQVIKCPKCGRSFPAGDETTVGDDAASAALRPASASAKKQKSPTGRPDLWEELEGAESASEPPGVIRRSAPANRRGAGPWTWGLSIGGGVLALVVVGGLLLSYRTGRGPRPAAGGPESAAEPASPREDVPVGVEGLASGGEATTVAAPLQMPDVIVFGDAESERRHALRAAFPTPSVGLEPAPSEPSTGPPSDVVTGGLGQTARRLLPRRPNPDIYGGHLTFTMAVDPVAQNSFTIKLWGEADPKVMNDILLECEGKEIGLRHTGGDHQQLWDMPTSWFKDRFLYGTGTLPLHLTRGKHRVAIRLRSLGGSNVYDHRAYFKYFQHLMDAPSLGLYRAYTHVGGYFDPVGEPQAVPPTPKTPRDDLDLDAVMKEFQEAVDRSIAKRRRFDPGVAIFLARCYNAPWCAAYHKPEVLRNVMTGIDAMVAAYGADPGRYMGAHGNASWGGYFGPVGEAIRLLWPQLQRAMDERGDLGGTLGVTSRRRAWSAALRASVDHGRFARRFISNQDIICALNIYTANRGLLLVDPENAIREEEALRYLYEASGVSPYSGNDLPGGGPVPRRGTCPYGPNWYLTTSKGLTKEDGFVGTDYGEEGTRIMRMAILSGDEKLLAQARKMCRARAPFRFPTLDADGYLIMIGPDPIACRNRGLPSHLVYLSRCGSDDFAAAALGAEVIGEDLLGYFQQAHAEGQLAPIVKAMDPSAAGAPEVVDAYAKIRLMPRTGITLPMTGGNADFAWGDEEDMMVAAKHGDERFWACLHWHAPSYISGLAKVFHLTPQTARVAEVPLNDQRFIPTGTVFVAGPWVEGGPPLLPPDNPVSGSHGVPYSIAMRSDLVEPPPQNRDGGRGTGYTLRYGHWLVAINAHHRDTYEMQLPADFTTATDLVSQGLKSRPVILEPKTTVVFYLPSTSSGRMPPGRTLFTLADGNGHGVLVVWKHAGGATSYTVKRATQSGGPYSIVARDVKEDRYTDLDVVSGTRYYYVVTSANDVGESGHSPETAATAGGPVAEGPLPDWASKDISTVGAPGVARANGGTLTITGGGRDVYGKEDSFFFTFVPLVGNGSITARVVTMQESDDPWPRAGVMIRKTLDADSALATTYLTAGKAAAFNFRGEPGGDVLGRPAHKVAAPYWVRLTRDGDSFGGEVSADGKTWQSCGGRGMEMPHIVYVGLFVCAHSKDGLYTSTFDNVSVSTGKSP